MNDKCFELAQMTLDIQREIKRLCDSRDDMPVPVYRAFMLAKTKLEESELWLTRACSEANDAGMAG